MNDLPDFDRVSVHGGHSEQFCNHARDSLLDVVQAYIRQGFAWVGITEHMPPPADRFMYPDERDAGWNAAALEDRFNAYIAACRSLQSRYRPQIDIYVGFETETYSAVFDHIRRLKRQYRPDYMVGSVHHVNDICFDYSPERYRQAVRSAGGPVGMYLNYFDQQYNMIIELEPEVVGHFDLVRIYDDDYQSRLAHPQIADRIRRNLELIAKMDLILDLNLRSYVKGFKEPYPGRDILQMAVAMGIAIVPGDDSHGVADVGLNLDRGVDCLKRLGGTTRWRRPVNT